MTWTAASAQRRGARVDSLIAHRGLGKDNNRAVAFLELRWGRLVRWEDYEDTERVAAWDREQSATV